MTSIAFTVEGKPQGKGRPRFRIIQPRNGKAFPHAYTDPGTKAYEQVIATVATVAMRSRALAPFTCPVEFCVCAVMPVPQSWSVKKRNAALTGDIRPTGKPDFDNIEKVVADALKGICWHDDSQVVSWSGKKKYGKDPCLQVEVHTLEPTTITGLF